MTLFFGRRWDSPMCDGATERPVPVGEMCALCGEPIEAGDSGTFMLYITGLDTSSTTKPGALRPSHLECDLRQALGGIGHQLGACRCHTDGDDDPDMGLPYRESARRVMAHIEKLRGRSMFEFNHGDQCGCPDCR